ncbi:hypothetical protein ACFQ08_19995, partial [Streptosporangium algeriense]
VGEDERVYACGVRSCIGMTADERAFAVPLAGRLRGDDAELRAHLVAAQVGGLLTSLHVVRDPVLTGAPRPALVSWYGPAVQRLIDGDPAP